MVPGQGREGGWARGPRSLHVKRKSLQPLHSSTTIKARVGRYQAETPVVSGTLGVPKTFLQYALLPSDAAAGDAGHHEHRYRRHAART